MLAAKICGPCTCSLFQLHISSARWVLAVASGLKCCHLNSPCVVSPSITNALSVLPVHYTPPVHRQKGLLAFHCAPTCLICHSHRWNTACSPLVELARQCNWKGWQCTGIGAAISVVPPVQYAVMQLQCATTSCQPSLGCSACGGATAVQYNMLPIKVDWSAVTQTYILWPPWAVSDEAWQTKQPWCLDSHWWLRPGFESRNLWSACLLDADAYAVPLRSCHPVPSVTVPPKLKVCALLFPPAPKCCRRVVRSCSWSWSHDGLATSFFKGLSATPHTSVIRTQQTLLWLKELHLSALSHAGHD